MQVVKFHGSDHCCNEVGASTRPAGLVMLDLELVVQRFQILSSNVSCRPTERYYI